MVLKQYLRGSILMFSRWRRRQSSSTSHCSAQAIVDRIVSGDMPIETGAMTELLSNSSSGSDSPAVTISTSIFSACWLIGIIDAYRVGIALEE